MFKGIISREFGEPWPPQGMSTALWLLIQPEEVIIADLIATQSGVYFHGLDENHPPMFGDPHPHVVVWENEYYFEDGHHRVVRARLRGDNTILARVLRTTSD